MAAVTKLTADVGEKPAALRCGRDAAVPASLPLKEQPNSRPHNRDTAMCPTLKQLQHPAQTRLLQFRDPMLEAQFGLYHSRLMRSVDTLWFCFATVLLVVALCGSRARGEPALPAAEWCSYFIYPGFGMVLQAVAPRLWARYREYVWCAHRFDVMLGTCQQSSFVFREGRSSLFMAYGMAAMLVNTIGHKVRFHVQLLLTAATYVTAAAYMAWNGSVDSRFMPSPRLLACHALSTVVLPCLLVYVWDSHTRVLFLKHARRTHDQQAALRGR